MIDGVEEIFGKYERALDCENATAAAILTLAEVLQDALRPSGDLGDFFVDVLSRAKA